MQEDAAAGPTRHVGARCQSASAGAFALSSKATIPRRRAVRHDRRPQSPDPAPGPRWHGRAARHMSMGGAGPTDASGLERKSVVDRTGTSPSRRPPFSGSHHRWEGKGEKVPPITQFQTLISDLARRSQSFLQSVDSCSCSCLLPASVLIRACPFAVSRQRSFVFHSAPPRPTHLSLVQLCHVYAQPSSPTSSSLPHVCPTAGGRGVECRQCSTDLDPYRERLPLSAQPARVQHQAVGSFA